MSARLKSSVLRREERGFGSISMGRLIVCGMVGGVAFMFVRLIGVGFLMIPCGLGAFIGALIFTSGRHGIPLYLHIFITLKARLLLSNDGLGAQFVNLFEMNLDDLTLDTSKLFYTPSMEEGTLDEWEIVPDSDGVAGFEVFTDTLELH